MQIISFSQNAKAKATVITLSLGRGFDLPALTV
jgi:hypothetical protein